jgi:uncharacterized protein
MGISKGERFGREDIYVDYPFEEVMFRWDHTSRKVYRRFYDKAESGPVPHDNGLYNQALQFGDEIQRDVYIAGKRSSPQRRNSNTSLSIRQTMKGMRYRRVAIAGAIAAAAGLISFLGWHALAPGIQRHGFKRYPPEKFFSGPQLVMAQAIRDGNLATVKELAPKTDLATPGNGRTTLLSFAVQETVPVKDAPNNVRFLIVSELVRDGAKPEQPFGQNDADIAYLAAQAHTPNLLNALLAGGMSPDLRYNGDTPLLFATAQDTLLPQLRTLVEHRANVNLQDSLRETALFEATRLRQWDAVDYLLAHGADPTVANSNGLRYAKVLYNQLTRTPKDSPQLDRIEAIGRRIVASGGQWPPK